VLVRSMDFRNQVFFLCPGTLGSTLWHLHLVSSPGESTCSVPSTSLLASPPLSSLILYSSWVWRTLVLQLLTLLPLSTLLWTALCPFIGSYCYLPKGLHTWLSSQIGLGHISAIFSCLMLIKSCCPSKQWMPPLFMSVYIMVADTLF
jgi:hypothetical protein